MADRCKHPKEAHVYYKGVLVCDMCGDVIEEDETDDDSEES